MIEEVSTTSVPFGQVQRNYRRSLQTIRISTTTTGHSCKLRDAALTRLDTQLYRPQVHTSSVNVGVVSHDVAYEMQVQISFCAVIVI